MKIRFASKFRFFGFRLLGLISVFGVGTARYEPVPADSSPTSEVDAAAEVEQINAQGYQPFVIGTKPSPGD